MRRRKLVAIAVAVAAVALPSALSDADSSSAGRADLSPTCGNLLPRNPTGSTDMGPMSCEGAPTNC